MVSFQPWVASTLLSILDRPHTLDTSIAVFTSRRRVQADWHALFGLCITLE